MGTAIKYAFIHVRVQGKQVGDFFNFEIQERGDFLVLYCESKNKDRTYTNFKYLYPWKIGGSDFLSDRQDEFSLPGGTLEIFDIMEDGSLKLRSSQPKEEK